MLKWFWSRAEQDNELLRAKNEQLIKEVEHLKAVLEARSIDLNAIRDNLAQTARNATPSLDFAKMEAFSIERMQERDEAPRTVIGYLRPQAEGNDLVGEWTLYCNDEHHERLVEEFNTYKACCQQSETDR